MEEQGSIPTLSQLAPPSGAIPKRPRRHDPEVLRAAAELLAPDVAEWCDQEVDDDLINSLAKALRYKSDGYEIARELESAWCISPDAQLVDILDNNRLYNAENEAVGRWVKEHGVTAALPDGTMVKWPRGVGEITGRYEDQATYIVWNSESRSEKKPRCGFIVAAEDCTPIPEDAALHDGAQGASTLGNSGRS